jgi:hypothetical protein
MRAAFLFSEYKKVIWIALFATMLIISRVIISPIEGTGLLPVLIDELN